jgi:hypothetical protein
MQYKFIPACNTKYFHLHWFHKTVGRNKITWVSAGKFHIFVTLFRNSSLLTEGEKSESMAFQERLQGKFLVPYFSAKLFYCFGEPFVSRN